MTTFYKKLDSGEFVDADKNVDDLFRQKSDSIVSARLGSVREKESARIREEIEADVRKTATEAIKAKVKEELEADYKNRLSEVESKANALDVQLRRKTIAAEYSFKPEMEEFLGDGTDEDMRAKADLLKAGLQPAQNKGLDKQAEPTSGNDGVVTLVKNN